MPKGFFVNSWCCIGKTLGNILQRCGEAPVESRWIFFGRRSTKMAFCVFANQMSLRPCWLRKVARFKGLRQSEIGVEERRRLHTRRTVPPLLDRHLLEKRHRIPEQHPDKTQAPNARIVHVVGNCWMLQEGYSSVQGHKHRKEEAFEE